MCDGRRTAARGQAGAMPRARVANAASALLLLLLGAAPPSVASAQQRLISVYGTVTCYADTLVAPQSTQQLADALKQLGTAAKAAGKQLKIRATRSVFHSAAGFPCPYSSSQEPLPAGKSAAVPSTIAVVMQDFNAVLHHDVAAATVRAQSGLQVLALLRWAEARGLTTEVGAPTNYAELTLGGVISASGHGTGSNVTSSISGITLELTWVDAAGNVHVSSRHSDEGRGLVGGVGMIGIITEVKLQLKPLTNTKAISINFLPDTNIGQDVLRFVKDTPNLALMWRPDLGKYNIFKMSETSEPADKGDRSGLVFPLPTMISNAFQLVLLPLQADINDTTVAAALNPLNCLTALTSVAYLRWASKNLLPQVPGAPLDVAIAQAKAVGPTGRIMAGGCEPFCVWNSELTVDDIEFAIELNDFPAWVDDIKRIFAEDLREHGAAPDRCMPFGGYVFLRFGTSNDDNMAATSGMVNPMYVELTYTKSRKLPGVPGKYQFVQDAMEQLTLCKYKGRPHWGKNYDRTFGHPRCPLRDLLPNFDKQMQLQAKYDPDRVFEGPLLTRVITRAPAPLTPGCDVARSCFCEADVHCGRGHVCVPGAAFPEYKLCKPAGLKAKLAKLG